MATYSRDCGEYSSPNVLVLYTQIHDLVLGEAREIAHEDYIKKLTALVTCTFQTQHPVTKS